MNLYSFNSNFLTSKRLIQDVSDWTEIATKKLFHQEIKIEKEIKLEYNPKFESKNLNFLDFIQRNLHLISSNFHDTNHNDDSAEINEEFISYSILFLILGKLKMKFSFPNPSEKSTNINQGKTKKKMKKNS
jgi:hypothetical protein